MAEIKVLRFDCLVSVSLFLPVSKEKWLEFWQRVVLVLGFSFRPREGVMVFLLPLNYKYCESSYPAEVRSEIFLGFSLPKVS